MVLPSRNPKGLKMKSEKITSKKEEIVETPVVPPKPTAVRFVEETESMFDMFKKDEVTLMRAIKDRSEQIDSLKRDQGEDAEKLLRVRGALAVLNSLRTKFHAQLAQGDH